MKETAQQQVSTERAPESMTSRLFGGRDPFTDFSADPFETWGTSRMFGRGFDRAISRMEDLSEDLLGVRTPLMRMPRMEMGKGGSYSVQSTTMTSFTDEKGNVHTEQFASSDVGNVDEDVREAKQMYANSESKVMKHALEQHVGGRAHKVVRVRGVEDQDMTTEMFKGMEGTDKDKAAFKEEFGLKAEKLPKHREMRGLLRDMPGLDVSPLEGLAGWTPALEQGTRGCS